MAEGVENCCVLVCFLTSDYQASFNCKKELTYASQLHKPIIPCLIGGEDNNRKWRPSQWLGLTIADLLYLDFTDINDANFEEKCQQLQHKINSVLGQKPIESSEQATFTEEKYDESDDSFDTDSSAILPNVIREGPQLNDAPSELMPKKYANEGDSVIRLIDQSKDIQCNQDLYARNGQFTNSFTFPRFIFHNTSSQSVGILQLLAEYENCSSENMNQWIPCECSTNQEQQIMNIEPNKLIVCSITVKIQLHGSPGVDNQHRCRAHPLLPQPLRLKVQLEDTQMKHASLILEQVNKPLMLPTLEKLIERLSLSRSNILDFVSADDCSIDVRYFVLIHYSNEPDSAIQFSFGCDLSGLRSPSWDKEYIKTLEKNAKQKNEFELIVHENIFNPLFHCTALFNDRFKLQGIRVEIKTTTSSTIQTVPFSLAHIFKK